MTTRDERKGIAGAFQRYVPLAGTEGRSKAAQKTGGRTKLLRKGKHHAWSESIAQYVESFEHLPPDDAP